MADITLPAEDDTPPAPGTVRVWDPLLRLIHWGIAAAFLTAWLSAEEVMVVHEAAGLSIIALVGVRALWGLIGSTHARFTDFVPSGAGLMAYLRALVHRRADRHLGHNPAGGAMALTLWFCLLGTAALGLLTRYPISALRPYGHWLEEAHELLANGTLVLVGLHLAGVLVSSLLHRENLIRSMLTGRKRAG
ncbi:cytochrome b/b6 domain-containing protein [Niveispirillum sp.]|uniref:cytochrome b/b6 domain-containing protein n=1 Tax=Niveispirillum sp. TaxID=1917217 RepID=UPI001B667996|nr:cytochrome b/b6 domain-containing protein [Niveispirillum sp.]MBP7339054.1 cytochrome b/b6 domain-containing protein [Niveispirillum sp.]